MTKHHFKIINNMRDYNITDARKQGRLKKRIRLTHLNEVVFELIFDETEQKEAIKAADIFILKNNLPYNTKRFKPAKR